MIKLMEDMTKEELIEAFKKREQELYAKIESDRISKEKLIREKKHLSADIDKMAAEIKERKLELIRKD